MLRMNTAHPLPEHVFREYDIRGVAGTEISDEFAFWLGFAFGQRVKSLGHRSVVAGRDNRFSSPWLHRALTTGLCRCGVEVYDVGEVTTPAFYFSLEHLGQSCGLQVTASHNPAPENGFKIAVDKTTIFGEEIRSLRADMAALAARESLPAAFEPDPAMVHAVDIRTPYLDMLRDRIRLGPRRLKVVVDCGNGTASRFAPDALAAWGCDVIPLYCDSDPAFPNHHPDPVEPDNLRDLIAKVRETGADLGVAFDGDGDRLGVIDDQGNILWGDQLMILFWREILPKYPGCDALVEVKCSQALVDEIRRLGGKPVFHRTGHSHIKATMRRIGTPFTGEMSGHLFFKDEYFGYDDALYAAGRLLRILSHTNDRLSVLFRDVPRYHATPETRVACPEADKSTVIDAVKRYFEHKHEVITIDGVRVQFPDGWALVRSSNTQPMLVMRAESVTPEGLREIKRSMEDAIRSSPPGRELVIAW